MRSVPARLHRKGCRVTLWAPPSRLATPGEQIGVEALAYPASAADVGAHFRLAGHRYPARAALRLITCTARIAAAVALCTQRFTSKASAAHPAAKNRAVAFVGLDEPVPVHGHRDRQPALGPVRLHADGEHHEVVGVGVTTGTLGVHPVQHRSSARRVPGDLRHLGLDEAHLRVFPYPPVEVLEAIDGANVDVVDRRARLFRVLLGDVAALLERRHAADARAVPQVVAVPRAGALDEGDVARFPAVGGAQQLSGAGAQGIHQALELDAGDHVRDLGIGVGMDPGRVVGAPAGRPDDGAGRDVDALLGHVEVDRVVAAGRPGPFRVGGAEDPRVEHEALRVGHEVRQPGALAAVHPEVVVVVETRPHRVAAGAAGGAPFVDVTRRDPQGCRVVAGPAPHLLDLGQGQDPEPRVAPDAPQVDLEAAHRVAQLREVLVELGDTPPDEGLLLDEDDLLAGFRRFQGGADSADSRADYENGLAGGNRVGHVPFSASSIRRIRRWSWWLSGDRAGTPSPPLRPWVAAACAGSRPSAARGA